MSNDEEKRKKPPGPDDGHVRQPAAHVQAALGGLQRQAVEPSPGNQRFAGHVEAAIGATLQGKRSEAQNEQRLAPHVQRAISVPLQPKSDGSLDPNRSPAPHVRQATVRAAQPKLETDSRGYPIPGSRSRESFDRVPEVVAQAPKPPVQRPKANPSMATRILQPSAVEVDDFNRLDEGNEMLARRFRGQNFNSNELKSLGRKIEAVGRLNPSKKRFNFFYDRRSEGIQQEITDLKEQIRVETDPLEKGVLKERLEFVEFRQGILSNNLFKGRSAAKLDKELAAVSGRLQQLRLMTYAKDYSKMFRGNKLSGNFGVGELDVVGKPIGIVRTGIAVESREGNPVRFRRRINVSSSQGQGRGRKNQAGSFQPKPDRSSYNRYKVWARKPYRDWGQRENQKRRESGKSVQELREDPFITNELHPEFNIYNNAARLLKAFCLKKKVHPKTLAGTLVLYTEFEQCPGCKSTMQDFISAYPAIKVRVFSALPYPQSDWERRKDSEGEDLRTLRT